MTDAGYRLPAAGVAGSRWAALVQSGMVADRTGISERRVCRVVCGGKVSPHKGMGGWVGEDFDGGGGGGGGGGVY